MYCFHEAFKDAISDFWPSWPQNFDLPFSNRYFDGGRESYKLLFEPLRKSPPIISSSEIKRSKLVFVGCRQYIAWPILMCFIRNVLTFYHGSWPLKVKVKLFSLERVILFEIPFSQKKINFVMLVPKIWHSIFKLCYHVAKEMLFNNFAFLLKGISGENVKWRHVAQGTF